MYDVEGTPEQRANQVLRDEQRLIAVLGVANVLFWAADVLSSARMPWDTLGLRLGWMALTQVLAWALGQVSVPARWWVRIVAGAVVPAVMFGLICWRLGGVASPLYAWMCVLPLLTLAVSYGRLSMSMASLACTLVSGGAVAVASGLTPRQVEVWELLFLASGLVALQCASFFRWMDRAQAETETRRQAAQEALVLSQARAFQAERMAQVGQLAAGVAHEVNNPLAYIQSNLRYVQKECGSPDADLKDLAAALEESMAGVERIRQIVQDLTRYSRSTEAPEMVGPCPLPTVIEESVRLASVRMKRLAVQVVVPAQVPLVRADPRRLSQVLLNLLLNSADALEDAQVRGPRVALRVLHEAERVRLVLEDNGPGIPPEHLPRLFTPYFTTKAPGKGTGLGLALSRQYVEGFGGSLRAENRPEGGARFTVELPAA
jgi:two-component system sensor histidine kinase PhcS